MSKKTVTWIEPEAPARIARPPRGYSGSFPLNRNEKELMYPPLPEESAAVLPRHPAMSMLQDILVAPFEWRLLAHGCLKR